jgi:hypothetical protein
VKLQFGAVAEGFEAEDLKLFELKHCALLW